MNRTRLSTLALVASIAAGALAPGAAAQQSPSAAAFAALTSLVGEWTGAYQGTAIRLTYTLTAEGSALMEVFRPAAGPVMITMFTVDGDRVRASHYCSAGNQPLMTTDAIRVPDSTRMAFGLDRVTGLKTPATWHNTALVMMLGGRSRLTQQWTWLANGETGTTVFEFTRVP